MIGGILGTIFIKCNIWWCRFRKTSKLGNYPVLEVVLVAVATALLAYPNEYTRMNTSELIYLLFCQCGVTNQQGICDYKDRNFTNVNHGVSIAEAGSGVNIHTIFKNLYGHRLQFFFYIILNICSFHTNVTTIGLHSNVGVITSSGFQDDHHDFHVWYQSTSGTLHSFTLHGKIILLQFTAARS